MNMLAKLKACKNLGGLAILLGLKPSDLSYIIHVIPDDKKYTTFTIPKKNGSVRKIDAPVPKLRMAQRRLEKLLTACFLEIEAHYEVKAKCVLAHGFIPHRSIISNADRHTGRRFVINADIANFFPSIHFGRVRGFFMKNRHFELDVAVATAIAQLACHNKTLPQGSPCSPVISNLIVHVLDVHLSRAATQHGFTYTRYADDLTFSTNKKAIPAAIATRSDEYPHAWALGDEIAGRILRAGFNINHTKTRVQYRDSRQDATGLVVNKKINVPAEYYKQTRVMCSTLIKYGSCYVGEETNVSTTQELRGRLSYLFHIKGILNHYKRISVVQGKKDDDARPGHYKIYRKFLNFIHFHANECPTILCEGKTDRAYLTHAIKEMATSYPELVEIGPKEKNLLVKFFKYSRTTHAVQDLNGGTGDLKSLIFEYENLLEPLKFPGGKQPVIIIVDNDSGSTNIWGAINRVAKPTKMIDGSKPFYHVIANLYVLPIPKLPGMKETFIEHLFEPGTYAMPSKGRTFEPDENKVDPAKHYPKAVFADLVGKNRSTIKFDGFIPVLDRIMAIKAHHATLVGP
jgi:retron-type reverse transcriptase